MPIMDLPLQEAIKRAGGKSALARLVGVTPQAVTQWKHIPLHHVLRLEDALGITRQWQRPEIYPLEAAE